MDEIRVLVTEATSQVAYQLLYLLANGDILLQRVNVLFSTTCYLFWCRDQESYNSNYIARDSCPTELVFLWVERVNPKENDITCSFIVARDNFRSKIFLIAF